MNAGVPRSFHGIAVPEPFRWLENAADERVHAWVRDQAMRAEEFLGRCDEGERCRSFLAASHPALDPVWSCVRGRRRFHLARQPQLEQAVLCVSSGFDTRLLFDPNPGHQSVNPDYLSVSPSGDRIAFGVSAAGEASCRMYVCETASGRIIDSSRVVTAVPMFTWLPDELSFFYSLFRQVFPEDGSGDVRPDGLYQHRIGADWRTDACIRRLDDGTVRMVFAVLPTQSDEFLVATHQFSSHSTTFELHGLVAPPQPGATLFAGGYNAYLGTHQGELYFHSALDAPMGRIVAIKAEHPEPAHWRVVVAASDYPLARPVRFPGPARSALGPAGLLVAFVEHAHHTLRFYGHDGVLRDRLELPLLCTLDSVEWTEGAFRIVAQSFLVPRVEYRYEPDTHRLRETARVPLGQFDADRYQLRQVFYSSFDGTRVPMYLLHRKELPLHGNHPALLYGYGGFGQSITPEYNPEIPLWLELGGVYALANIRGGGEYGEAWHAAGTRLNKQSSFDDYYAAAEFLIAEGITGAGKLTARGLSNGGLLTAVSVNQRPELFAAVITEIPLTDMLWFDETPAGRSISAEYGSASESPAMFAALRAYSPAHNVHGDGPPQLEVVADQELNAPPGQAYKFVAARQKALADAGRDTPVLLRLVKGEGHGGWTEDSTRGVIADEVAFLWHIVHGPSRAPDRPAAEVPMRDGIMLRANVWLPARISPAPAVLLRTPYGNGTEEFARYGLQDYLNAGFAVVFQSVRGRGRSQGEFGFFFVEGQDGYDAVEWAAAQPWCDGNVAMDGGSYLGTAQWLAAREHPPHLKCIMPFVPAGDWFYEIPYIGGALQVDWAFSWLSLMAGRKFDFGENGDHNLERFRPLADAERVLGGLLPLYRNILAHPTPDGFWSPLQWSAEDFEGIEIPVLTVTGWFDGDQAGSMRYWRGLEQRSKALQHAHLIVGPWRHAECYLGGESRVGEIDCGTESVLPMRRIRVDFLRAHLQGKPLATTARVRVFVTGSCRWLEFDHYPPPKAQTRAWFLCAESPANGVQGGGRLSDAKPSGTADRFCYDPLDPVPYAQGALDHGEIEQRADVLVYSSQPLERPVTVIGAVEVVLHAASDAPDTDFTAKLLDVHPDGRAVSLTHVGGIARARYHRGLEKPEVLRPDEPFELNIRLSHVGHTFQRAHRIRLEVSSSCFPLADPNTNTGADFATDTAHRKARQTVLHDAAHPSRLLMPVMADS